MIAMMKKQQWTQLGLVYEIAYVAYFVALSLLELAKLIGIERLIELAEEAVRNAARFYLNATVDWQNARDAYIKCRKTKHASGGCESGGCESGGCESGGCGYA